jgi:predicted nucleic acid-binding protein
MKPSFAAYRFGLTPQDIYDDAFKLACQHALGALDAFHLASAIYVKAEFISAEKPTKPLYRAYVQAFSIY